MQSLNKKQPPKVFVNNNKDLNISISLKDLVRFEQDITTLNFKKLIEYTNRLEESGLNGTKYKILYLSIITTSINCLLS